MGVNRVTFEKMIEILQKGHAEKHRRRGGTSKLNTKYLLLTWSVCRKSVTYVPIIAR